VGWAGGSPGIQLFGRLVLRGFVSRYMITLLISREASGYYRGYKAELLSGNVEYTTLGSKSFGVHSIFVLSKNTSKTCSFLMLELEKKVLSTNSVSQKISLS
jgi:hypothetical protein